MNSFVQTERVVAFVIGTAAMLVVSRVAGWWLDSATGVGIVMAVLCGIGFIVARLGVVRRKERVIALWAGSLVGTAVQLFVRDPGTISPLVLMVGGFLMAVAVLAGTAIAWLFD